MRQEHELRSTPMLSADRDAAMDAPASPTRIHTSMHRERETNRERERERISASDPLVHIARNREKWEPRGRRERRGRRRTTLTIARERSSTRRECIQGPRTRAEGVNALVQRGRVRVPRTPAKILVRGCVDVLIIAVSRVPRRERELARFSPRACTDASLFRDPNIRSGQSIRVGDRNTARNSLTSLI